ncbi:MAG: L-2-amino-thiazoline-4-carboxylic acid hydrolase [Anaerolineae bacterium]
MGGDGVQSGPRCVCSPRGQLNRGASLVRVAVAWALDRLGPRRRGEREIQRKALVAYQRLCRPVMEELLGTEGYWRCCAAMLREYDGFAVHLPLLRDRNNRRQFFGNVPFMLSLYRALRGEFALNQEEALRLLSSISAYKVRKEYERAPWLRFLMARLGRNRLFNRLGLLQVQYRPEEYGWAATYPVTSAEIAFDMTRCGLVDWFRDRGAPEIAPIACEGDYIAAELLPGLRFIRTKTLAAGDAICDFRYVRARED